MGTHTHDEDLMMILPALRNICDKRPGKVEIQVIAGVQELATKEKMEDLPVRWIATEPGEEEYPLFMLWFTGQVSWDLAIAPLEDHPFNHGKSDIKFLDYSAIAVPAVFSDVPAYRHSVVHMQNGLLARNQIGSWTECLDRLIDDSELRRFLAANAYEQLLANRTLKQTSGQWLEAVQWSLREPEKAVQHHVSIVIPVKNAEPYLRETLQAIFDQDTRLVYEVILVDSGSKDRTIETGSAFPVRIIQIPPEAFNHGLTRNLGVTEAAAESEFIVFLSQDAKPENNRWLEYLIQPLLEDETVAGVFSRHLPRPGACASLVRQLTQLTQSGGGEKLVKQHPGSQAGFDSHRFFLNFFSNTSSAIRRKVWDEIPFQRVDFAEDALWADQVIQAGYSIVFEPASVVLHSHNYNLIEQFRQNVDHARGFDRSFAPQAYRSPGVWIKQFLGIPYQVYQDWKFVLSSPYFAHSSLYYKIKMMLLSIPWQIATVSGAWAGAHLENMPGWLVKNLSRQARIKSQ
jgi:rhamnosyltransferase